MNYHEAKQRAKILRAVAHPMRILIVEALKKSDRCVSDLCSLGKINQSNVSRHLATLKREGIVSDRRVGNRVVYRLETPSVLNVFEPAAEAVRVDSKRRSSRTASV